jgi:hypothetical protein
MSVPTIENDTFKFIVVYVYLYWYKIFYYWYFPIGYLECLLSLNADYFFKIVVLKLWQLWPVGRNWRCLETAFVIMMLGCY